MKILLAGASGFIGSHLVKLLCHLGHEVTAFCRSPEKIKSLEHPGLKIVAGLMDEFSLVSRLVEHQDVVIHCALGWGDSAVEMLQHDTLPAVNLFEQAVAAGVKKIIYTSSSVAVGEYRPLMTEETVCRPLDMYSATKLSTEAYLLALSRNTKTECNILRPVYTFGNPAAPGCATQPDQRFWNMAKMAVEGMPIELIKNDGTQLIWVDDLIKTYQYFLDTSSTREILTVGSDSQYTWETCARKIIHYVNSTSKIILQDRGWAPGGCIWSNMNMKKILPEAAECDLHLQDHIEYVCEVVSARHRSLQDPGVSA